MKCSQRAQDEAYHAGLKAWSLTKPYANPYDSDKAWLCHLAFQQGWCDAIADHKRAEYARAVMAD